MVKGRKCPTPLDPEERESYKTKRAKNNQAALKHRERARQSLIEGYKMKEERDRLTVVLEHAKLHLSELKKEKQLLLDFLLTHDCVSSKLFSASNLQKCAFRVVLPETNRIQRAPSSISPTNSTIHEPILSSRTHLPAPQMININTNNWMPNIPVGEVPGLLLPDYSSPQFHSSTRPSSVSSLSPYDPIVEIAQHGGNLPFFELLKTLAYSEHQPISNYLNFTNTRLHC
ncbi:hypothetical protein PENTCL1PPCAC_21341 [Pristionchus entomophagus]|uniref:BZIP domain-containing protein n=1 Tax=Pristionchus entomophagus TaxID=358040 RepID=A0AAV5TXH0_9BILA|nr:hypothetical protein PENTCL1PPCAC_21341 [Pristionchus entomophagus]